MEHNLYTNMGVIDVCTGFDMFEVKVPMIFFGTVGFSPRRDGRCIDYLLLLLERVLSADYGYSRLQNRLHLYYRHKSSTAPH